MTSTRPAAVIVLAAGQGVRMRSATPKVLHRVGGRTLLHHVVHAARGLDPMHLVVVVSAEAPGVVEHLAEVDQAAQAVVQDDLPGTGRAAECGLAALPSDMSGPVVITYADTPLLTTSTLRLLLDRHAAGPGVVTLVSAAVDDPAGYGRVLRDPDGLVGAIVEERDVTPEQRAVREINAGFYAFDAGRLRSALARVGTDNAQGEKYLTDVIAVLRADGHRPEAVLIDDPWQVAGVNDRVQLAIVGAELNRRVVERWMLSGVTVVDPATTWLDVDVTLGRDVTVRPHTQILGASTVSDGAVIGPECTLTDVEVGSGATVVRADATLAVIGPGATVGPFAYLRPGTELAAGGKIGTFVETKQAVIGAGAKIPHLSYVGDADVGPGTNIGAGTIFANYDGQAKHHTTVGKHCRTGANNVFVAPVTIGDGAATGGGTVVRADVPPGALALSAGPQRTLEDWVERRRPGTPSAAAAMRAKSTGAGSTGAAEQEGTGSEESDQ